MKIVIGVNTNDLKVERINSESGKKFIGAPCSEFIAPYNEKNGEHAAIVGRMHTGDENGITEYYYGNLSILNMEELKGIYEKASDLSVVIRERHTTDTQPENHSTFECPKKEVFVGRSHEGDENGKTWMQWGKLFVKFGDKYYVAKRSDTYYDVDIAKESNGKVADAKKNVKNADGQIVATGYAPMFYRQHIGDENAHTFYKFAFYEVETSDIKDFK